MTYSSKREDWNRKYISADERRREKKEFMKAGEEEI